MRVELVSYWNDLLATFPVAKQDVYFKEEYVRLYETDTDKAYCLVCREEENTLLFPLLRRSFSFEGNTYFDFETAYGYGGPVTNSEDESFRIKALVALKDYCEQNGFVAGFVRFHPLFQNHYFFEVIGRLIADRKTVAVNLNLPINEVWLNEIHSKNRNIIRKAEKAGCTFLVDDQFEHIGDFIRLYDTTMDKLSADGFYYFKRDYYKNLVDGIPNSFLGCVRDLEGRIISAAIFMYSGPYGHYHLSGSDKSQLGLSPNNFMLWEAAKELQKRGVKCFHLGGGSSSDEDNSLFLFKRRFSKETYQFYIGKLVFNREVYDALCTEWEKKNPQKAEHYKHHLLKYKY